MIEPMCPMGHQMELFQVASGSWRYGCLECATSYKAIKRRQYGWISPMKSTKERAKEAAMRRLFRKPIKREIIFLMHYVLPCWLEEKGKNAADPVILDKDSNGYFARDEFRARRFSFKTYGKEWRCWFGEYPSWQEREAAEWEV